MDHDTDIGGSQHRFPVTRNSAIVAARSDDHEVRRRGLETIVESYWKPAYKYLRIKWQASNEDAKDLVQGFFARAIEKDYFVSYDPTKASFQTFLRTCLDRFVTNQKKAQQRLKRGGGVDLFSLDFTAAEAELVLQKAASSMSPEDYFRREWVRSLFSLSIETLRERYEETGRGVYFRLFELYDLRDNDLETNVSYASLACEFGLNTTDITNYLGSSEASRKKRSIQRFVGSRYVNAAGTGAKCRGNRARN